MATAKSYNDFKAMLGKTTPVEKQALLAKEAAMKPRVPAPPAAGPNQRGPISRLPMPPANAAPARPAVSGAPAMKKGGSVAKASSRGDGIAQRGKTKGRYI